MRSVHRYCNKNGIHKTSRIDDAALDSADSSAISMVKVLLAFEMHVSCSFI